MLGIRYIKAEPTDFIIQYRKGKVVREGTGLSFFYFAPSSSLVLVPIRSVDIPFIFEEVTADFQQVTIQGQLTYRVADPNSLAQMMNYTLDNKTLAYGSDDPQKLPQRLINNLQVLARASFKALTLTSTLGQSDELVQKLLEEIKSSSSIASLGIEILDLSLLAIKPSSETARALEADARESILRKADEAVYARRNAAVEQERSIKENELNTDIAIENKKRLIREKQMDAEKAVQEKRREMKEADMLAKIELEKRNKDLVHLATANAREEADTKAYAASVMIKALADNDPKVLEALVNSAMQPSQLIAMAFKGLAESSEKIGNLNISSELLSELLEGKTASHESKDGE